MGRVEPVSNICYEFKINATIHMVRVANRRESVDIPNEDSLRASALRQRILLPYVSATPETKRERVRMGISTDYLPVRSTPNQTNKE